MKIIKECEEKIANLNKYKFANFPSSTRENANSLVGSYLLVREAKNFKLAQRCGPNGEMNIITPRLSLSAISSMVDILCDCLLENRRQIDYEIYEMEGKHKMEVESRADILFKEKNHALIADCNKYKNLYLSMKSSHDDLYVERRKVKAYMKRHFQL